MKMICLFYASILMIGLQASAQVEYALDGIPSTLEEEFRWILNRGRYDSAAENLARGTSYSNMPASCGPLAPHDSLTLAARHHSEDMATFDFYGHETITSLYYSVGDFAWNRASDEGYPSPGVIELIAGGYSTIGACYIPWWNSEAHRQYMYDANLVEVGCGHFYTLESSYHHYSTVVLGSRSGHYFFTGTLFSDSDTDGAYDQGEGVSGIKVTISIGGIATGWYDVSELAGNFAIPIADVPLDACAMVTLQNMTSNTVTLAIPVDYSTFTNVTINADELIDIGVFTRTSGGGNVGFRDFTISTPMPIANIRHAVEITWPSITGAIYQVQWASALDTNSWYNLGDPVVGNGGTNSVFSNTMGVAQRFFRVTVP